jgi:hypothetical protein
LIFRESVKCREWIEGDAPGAQPAFAFAAYPLVAWVSSPEQPSDRASGVVLSRPIGRRRTPRFDPTNVTGKGCHSVSSEPGVHRANGLIVHLTRHQLLRAPKSGLGSSVKTCLFEIQGQSRRLAHFERNFHMCLG